MNALKGFILLAAIGFMCIWALNTLFNLNIPYGLAQFIAMFSLLFTVAFVTYLGNKEK